MKPTPLALTPAQLQIIRRAALPVPVNWRSRYLELVADMLVPHAEVSDAEVIDAANRVVERMLNGRQVA